MRFAVVTAFVPAGEIPAIARAADELGYHSLSIADHVVDLADLATPYPYEASGRRRWDETCEWPDPWVLIGALSALTTRLRFFTSVYVAALRSPYLVANAVGTAARLSGGRVSLGVGVGWCREEFELLGQDFAGRGRRTDADLEVMARVWADGPPVPVLVGGLSEVALRRAARHDGWVGDVCTVQEAVATARRLAELRAEAGASGPFEVIPALSDAVLPEDFARAREGGVTEVMTAPWMYYHGRRAGLEQKIEGCTASARTCWCRWRGRRELRAPAAAGPDRRHGAAQPDRHVADGDDVRHSRRAALRAHGRLPRRPRRGRGRAGDRRRHRHRPAAPRDARRPPPGHRRGGRGPPPAHRRRPRARRPDPAPDRARRSRRPRPGDARGHLDRALGHPLLPDRAALRGGDPGADRRGARPLPRGGGPGAGGRVRRHRAARRPRLHVPRLLPGPAAQPTRRSLPGHLGRGPDPGGAGGAGRDPRRGRPRLPDHAADLRLRAGGRRPADPGDLPGRTAARRGRRRRPSTSAVG